MIRALMAMVVLSLGCVGCASVGLKAPTASVDSMDVKNVTAEGFTMNFGVNLTNPNAIDLPLTNADYSVGLAGQHAFSGQANPGGSLPAGGTQRVTLPVAVKFEDLLSVVSAVSKSDGTIPYTLDGGLTFDTGDKLIAAAGGNGVRAPLSYSGVLHLKDLIQDPMLLLRSPALQMLMKKAGLGL